MPFPSPGDLSKPGIEPESPTLQADGLLSEAPGEPWEVGGLGAYFEANGVFQPTVCWAERRQGVGVMLRGWLGGFSSAGMRGCWAQG